MSVEHLAGCHDDYQRHGTQEPYVGQVALQTGEIAEDLTYYFASLNRYHLLSDLEF